jgi:hypothetical protein
MYLTIAQRVENLENAVAAIAFAKEFGHKVDEGQGEWTERGKPDVIETPEEIVEAFRQGIGASKHEEPAVRTASMRKNFETIERLIASENSARTEDPNSRLILTNGPTVREAAEIAEQGDVVKAFREGIGAEPAIETRPSAKEFKYRMGSQERWARFAGWEQAAQSPTTTGITNQQIADGQPLRNRETIAPILHTRRKA